MRSTARFAAMTILACLAVSTARGQQTSPIAAGGWILGGSANVSHSHDDLSDLSSTSVSLSPYALRFVARRLAVGGSVTLSYGSSSGAHTDRESIGPSARYFFGDLSGKTFPFVSATVQPEWVHEHGSFTVGGNHVENETRLTELLVEGSVGITHIIASNVGVTGEAYWSENKTGGGGSIPDRTMSNYGLRFGFTIFAR